MTAEAPATCPRCRAEVGHNTASCKRCGAWLLHWSAGRTESATQPPPSPLAGPRRRVIDTPTTLAALRLIVATGMAVHGLAVITRLADDALALLGWIALWLPIDAYARATRRRPRE